MTAIMTIAPTPTAAYITGPSKANAPPGLVASCWPFAPPSSPPGAAVVAVGAVVVVVVVVGAVVVVVVVVLCGVGVLG